MRNYVLFILNCFGLFVVSGCTKSHTVVYRYSGLMAVFTSYLNGGEKFECVEVELGPDVNCLPKLRVGEMQFVFDNLNDIENYLSACGFKRQNAGWYLWWEGGYVSVSVLGNQKVMLRIQNSLQTNVLLSLGGVPPVKIPAERLAILDRFGPPSHIIKYDGVFH